MKNALYVTGRKAADKILNKFTEAMAQGRHVNVGIIDTKTEIAYWINWTPEHGLEFKRCFPWFKRDAEDVEPVNRGGEPEARPKTR